MAVIPNLFDNAPVKKEMIVPNLFGNEKTTVVPNLFGDKQSMRETDPWRGLSKAEEIRKAPSGMEKLKTSVKRKLAIFQKAGLEGLTLNNVTLKDLPVWKEAPEGTFEKAATLIEPVTTAEKLQHDITKLGYSLIPFYYAGRLVGWGKAGLTKPQVITRAAGAGGILGALEKPAEEEIKEYGELEARERAAVKSAAIFGGITGTAIGAQKVLSQISRARLKSVLEKADTAVKEIAPKIEQLDTVGAYQVLQKLNPYERNTVLNVLKQKSGMKPNIYKNWYEKNIGEPVYNTLITKLEKVMPESIKEKFIYRYDQPEEYAKLAEERIKNISLWREKAEQAGKSLTEGISQAESNIVLRALKEPTQLEILKTARPGLYEKALPIRNILDDASQQLAGLKTLPEETRKTILDNFGQYVKRVYETPEEKKGLAKFFIGRRAIREPKIYEKGKIVRETYEKALRGEKLDEFEKKILSQHGITLERGIRQFERQYEQLGEISNISTVGKTTQNRLNFRGIKTTDDLAKADIAELTNLLLLEERSGLDALSVKYVNQIKQIDDERASLRNIYQKRGLTGGAVGVERTGGLTGKQFAERVKPVKAQLKLEQDLKNRFDSLTNKRNKLLSDFKMKEGKDKFNKAWNQSENIKAEAEAYNSERRGLTSRINEFKNLLEKPQKELDIPYDVRRRLGEVTTAGYPVARSIQDMGYKIETARLFEQVAENPSFATSNILRGKRMDWTQMPDSVRMGSLRNKWVSPKIAEDIDGITKIIQKSDRIYQDLLSAWKMGKTTLNPATHGRNILSNAILLEMSGTPSHRIPDLISGSIDDIAKNTELYRQFKKAGLGLGTFKSAEIEALKGVYSGKSGLSNILEGAGKGLDKTFAGDLNRLYQLEEEVFKLARGRYLLEQGFTVESAFKDAEKWLFNYNKIPEFIRQVRTSPLGAPFATFQYKAMPRVLEALIKRPMTVIKYPLLMEGMEEYAIKKHNLTPEQVAIIKKDKPLTYILPFTDKHGNIRLFDLQYILPYGEVFEKRYAMGVPTFGIMGNPVISTPYNLFFHNRNPYTGQEIISEDASGVKKAKQTFQYIANQLLPPLTPGLGYPAESIRKAAEGRSDRYGIKYDYWWEVIGNVAGLKTKPVNMDIETFKKMRQSQWLWRKYDIKQGALIKDMSLTEEEKIKQFEELQEERIRGFNKLWENIISEKPKKSLVVPNLFD